MLTFVRQKLTKNCIDIQYILKKPTQLLVCDS